MRDDNRMHRFDDNARRFSARDAIIAVLVAAAVLVAVQGASMRATGEQLDPGLQRDAVLAASHPAGWVARRLPLRHLSSDLRSQLSPDRRLASAGAFGALAATPARAAGGVAPVTPQQIDPTQVDGPLPPRRALRRLLVTGDSLSTPLDLELARRLAGGSVKVTRDPHLGSGISKPEVVDWGRLSTTQVRARPDAVVVFIGANEGFPMRGPGGREVACCSASWAAIYATRARQMMDTYRRGGRAHVYWITVPVPREASHARIQRVVNAAIKVAAQPWAGQVTVIDSVPVFTPGGRYRDAMAVAGRRRIVREPDGIHLNQTGSGVLAAIVLRSLSRQFDF